MKTLLNNELAPLTFSWGFVEAPLERVADELVRWRSEPIKTLVKVGKSPKGGDLVEWQPTGQFATVEVHKADGSFRELLLKLPPLCQIPCRELLVSTGSNWTAYFDNGRQGGDPGSPVPVLAERTEARSLTVSCIENTLGGAYGTEQGTYGSIQFCITGLIAKSDQTKYRNIACMNDGGKWIFEALGMPQPFEQPEKYKARKIRDRFTAEMLEDYCKALGIRLFDESFYGPQGVLVARTDPLPEWDNYISLDEAQRQLGLKR